MEERQEECLICGQEVEVQDVKDVLCPDCLDTWQRENESTW
jgi:DNA-directed RNA polymerase subunit RPC12/RpoP